MSRMDLGEVRAGRSRERSRTVLLAIAYLLPLVLLLVSAWVPHRVPMPGETFDPATLSPWWWRLAVWLGVGLTVTSWITAFIKGQISGPVPSARRKLRIDDDALRLYDASTDAVRDEISLQHITSYMSPEHTDRVVLRLASGETLTMETGEKRFVRQLLPVLRERVLPRATRLPLAGLLEPGTALHVLAHAGLAIGWLAAFVLVAMLGVWLHEGLGLGGQNAFAIVSAITSVGAACALLLARRSVVIGSDGITIGAWRRRFVSFGDVQRAERPRKGVVEVLLRNGRRVRLYEVAGGPDLLEQLERTLGRYRAGQELLIELPKAVQRGSQDIRTWREALERADEGADYRREALDADRLTKLLENPAASPDDRSAAAFLLARRGEAERVRIAIDQTADRDLRAALEAAAEGELSEAQQAQPRPLKVPKK